MGNFAETKFREVFSLDEFVKSNSREKLNSQMSKLFKLMAKKKTKTIYMHNVSFALQTSDYSAVKLYRDTDFSKKILKVH